MIIETEPLDGTPASGLARGWAGFPDIAVAVARTPRPVLESAQIQVSQ